MIKTGVEKLDRYCEGVYTGSIPVGNWVRLAVARHYKDLERIKDKDFPYYFDKLACEHYVDFFESELKHYEGVISGKPMIFEPWQWFTFGSIFGWLKKELFQGYPIRRFRKAYIIIPKKNGKSILSGGTGLYMMDYDNWSAAQCYIMAKSDLHAKDLGYKAALMFVKKNEKLAKKYKIVRAAGQAGIYYPDNNDAFYKTITPKAESQDGRNVHFFGPDETKDWTDREIFELMVNGTVNAPNSLVLATTTAGPNQDSLGFEHQKYVEMVLDGTVEDESQFGVIYGIDSEDKFEVNEKGKLVLDEKGKHKIDEFYYERPELWAKANPNYNVSVYKETLTEMLPEARMSVSKRIAFCTKHLNEWFSNLSSFIKPEVWNACDKRRLTPLFEGIEKVSWENREEFVDNRFYEYFKDKRGSVTYAGLDLGSVDDFTALVLVIRNDVNDDWDVLPLFWIPDGTMQDRKNIHLLQPWINQGYIQVTPGATTDHNFVRFCLKKINEYLDIKEIFVDRSNADKLMFDLEEDGFEIVKFGQGYMSMKEAVNAFEKLSLENSLNFGMNPVLKWMNGNTVIQMDPAGNRKFNKEKAQDKIDGIVAGAMGVYASYVNQAENESIYNTRGAITL